YKTQIQTDCTIEAIKMPRYKELSYIKNAPTDTVWLIYLNKDPGEKQIISSLNGELKEGSHTCYYTNNQIYTEYDCVSWMARIDGPIIISSFIIYLFMEWRSE